MTDNLTILSQYEKEINELRITLPPKLQDKEVLPDDVLVRALLSFDFHYEHAKNLATNYIKARKDYPFMFDSTSNPKLEGLFGHNQTFLPKVKSLKGQRIFYTRCSDWDPDKHSYGDVCSSMLLQLELESLDYNLQRDGFVQIIDAGGLEWNHIRHINLRVIHAFGQLLTYYLPINVKQVIFINNNRALEFLWKMTRPLLPKQLSEKMIICGKNYTEVLSKHFPTEVVEQETFVPTQSDRDNHSREVYARDHLLQSTWDRVMRVKQEE